MSTESDTPTPRTDDAERRASPGLVYADFARELERRCAELSEHVNGLIECLQMGPLMPAQTKRKRIAAARAAVEKGKANPERG